MKPRILDYTYNVSAICPRCKSVTSFESKQTVGLAQNHTTDGRNFSRIMYVLSQCAGCGLGGFASISDAGNPYETYLNDFYPISIDSAQLPAGVPADIQEEFREAERCQAFSMNRAASALYRSVLEKTLKANGYTK